MAQKGLVQGEKIEQTRSLLRQRPWLVCGVLVVVCLICGFAAWGVLIANGEQETLIVRSDSNNPSDGGSSSLGVVEEVSVTTVVVDVSGAVVNPGIYELEEDSRVADAIEAAGGLADDADVSTLNRASKISDGLKITVPQKGDASAESGSAASSGSSSFGNASSGTVLVNINTATVEELQILSGVGPSTAQSIVEDREQNGLFSSTEDLMRVSGIGEKKFAKIKDSICV